MGHSRQDKAETHRRIVAIAARRLRERGLDGVSVADLMGEAGLTVGGFYKHFPSRDHLVAEAVAEAIAGVRVGAPADFAAAVARYLDPAHRDAPGEGCAIAALAPDLARCPAMTRGTATAEIARAIAGLDRLLGGDARAEAMLAYSAMVGALSLARVVEDEGLSREILTRVAERLTARAGATAGDDPTDASA